MSGLAIKKTPPKIDTSAEERIARQERQAEGREAEELRKLQINKRARRSSGRRMLMAPGVTAGDNRMTLQRTLGVARNPQ